jgi:hypothetical protein
MFKWLSLAVIAFSAAVSASPAAAAPTTAQCLECHSSMTEPVEIAKGVTVHPNVDQKKYAESVHGGFECVQCHMGIGAYPHSNQASKADAAVRAVASAISSKSKIDAIAQAACVQCHPDIYETYKKSVHGKNVMVKKSSDGPVCTSCHGSPHYIQPKTSKESAVNPFNVVRSCEACHEEKHLSEKYGFSPIVTERYLESFHGRKLKLGHSGAPSCASCHGAHDVKSKKDPSSPVVGANKIKTCAKCHPGATPKFVAAITHQPLHPIAHWSEIGLIVLTVGTFAFIIIHVLADLYSEIRQRLFKKGGNHE